MRKELPFYALSGGLGLIALEFGGGSIHIILEEEAYFCGAELPV